MEYAVLVADRTVEGSIRNWANNPLAPAGTVLEEAQALIYQTLRCREMRASTSLTLATGALYVAEPADFLDPIRLFDPYGCEIALRGEHQIEGVRAKDGSGAYVRTIPSCYGLYDGRLQFDCAADQDYALTYIYFRRPPLLAAGNPTNFITTRYPSLLRKACMVGVYDFFRNDAAKNAALQDLSLLLQSIPVMDDMSRRGEDDEPEYDE